jgi:hypothetical protein
MGIFRDSDRKAAGLEITLTFGAGAEKLALAEYELEGEMADVIVHESLEQPLEAAHRLSYQIKERNSIAGRGKGERR